MEKITRKRGIELHCHQCSGMYQDGKVDCENVDCALYPWMPYRRLEPTYAYFCHSPRHVGKVYVADLKAKVSDAQREAGKKLSERSQDGSS
jgi:hypothetical protein